SREMSSILDVEELLRRAAEQVKRVIDYQILSIMLYDEEQKVFRHRLDVKHGQRVQGRLRVAASEGIVGAAATLKGARLAPGGGGRGKVARRGERRNRGSGGDAEGGGARAGCDAGPAIFDGESRDAVGAGDPDAAQGENFGRAGSGEPAVECVHAGPRANAID